MQQVQSTSAASGTVSAAAASTSALASGSAAASASASAAASVSAALAEFAGVNAAGGDEQGDVDDYSPETKRFRKVARGNF